LWLKELTLVSNTGGDKGANTGGKHWWLKELTLVETKELRLVENTGG
jgi:hypothetical protein